MSLASSKKTRGGGRFLANFFTPRGRLPRIHSSSSNLDALRERVGFKFESRGKKAVVDRDSGYFGYRVVRI